MTVRDVLQPIKVVSPIVSHLCGVRKHYRKANAWLVRIIDGNICLKFSAKRELKDSLFRDGVLGFHLICIIEHKLGGAKRSVSSSVA